MDEPIIIRKKGKPTKKEIKSRERQIRILKDHQKKKKIHKTINIYTKEQIKDYILEKLLDDIAIQYFYWVNSEQNGRLYSQ